jgi:hypothetical protein
MGMNGRRRVNSGKKSPAERVTLPLSGQIQDPLQRAAIGAIRAQKQTQFNKLVAADPRAAEKAVAILCRWVC